jgi:hypothetical protein
MLPLPATPELPSLASPSAFEERMIGVVAMSYPSSVAPGEFWRDCSEGCK